MDNFDAIVRVTDPNGHVLLEAFKPNIPEEFISLGPVAIYFDANNDRLTAPEIRLKPNIAATDGVNTSFFPLGVISVHGRAAGR